MELVANYLFHRYIPKRNPLPFPKYLLPESKWYNSFWITKEGECVYPWEMDNRHLLNTVRFIHRTIPSLMLRYQNCGAHRHIEQGLYVYYQHEKRMKRDKVGRVAKGIINDVMIYCDLWTDYYLYMLLRREINLRGLENEL